MDHTETEGALGEALEATRVEDQLFVVLEGSQPGVGGARYSLSGIDEVKIGRGAARRAARVVENRVRRLVLELPDPRMSSSHAVLRRLDRSRYELEDLGSRNGTRVDGEAFTKGEVEAGAWLELGRTVLHLRARVEVPIAAPAELASADLADRPAGFRTLVPGHEASFERVERVAARSLAPILLLGETGAGKEMLARGIHELSRRKGPFIAVNCGALPETLVESMMLGHLKGAFSGAERSELGFVRSAHEGTLFLDEIGELPLESQAVLLRVLQEREVVPIGSSTPVKVDIRVVAATNAPLDEQADRGEFRSDLYARLAGFTHRLAPLRERREDLGHLIAELLEKHGLTGERAPTIGAAASRLLVRYPWPRNVRELEQCLTVAVALADGAELGPAHLPEAVQKGGVPALDLEDEETLKKLLLDRLAEHEGNISQVARSMGKARMQIQRWLKRFEIDPTAFRAKE